jgi:mono/diheme cytochrome c family protein
MMDETPTPRRGKSDWGMLVAGIAAGVVVIALLVIAFAVGYNLGETRAKEAAAESGPEETSGATETAGGDQAAAVLFRDTCGSCHTLQAAGTEGAIGPDLDTLQPSREQVLAAIANGGTGTGTMPPGLLTGADADAVADYVAASAGSRR